MSGQNDFKKATKWDREFWVEKWKDVTSKYGSFYQVEEPCDPTNDSNENTTQVATANISSDCKAVVSPVCCRLNETQNARMKEYIQMLNLPYPI